RPTGELVEELRHHLFEAVRLRLVSDVPLGAFLSGGIDSSAVVAVMSKVGAKPVKTFSIGFDEKDFSEVSYARQVARLYETDHHEDVLRPNAAELLPQLVYAYGEPFADPSALPTYLLSQMTRRHVTVALSGDGGDEGFAGYTRYAHEKMARLFQRVPRALLLPIAGFVERHFPGRKTTFLGEFGATVRLHARRVLMGEVPRYAAQFGHFTPEQMAELCPSDLKMRGFRGKWLLRKALRDLLPHNILYRQKQGFGIPHSRWLRGDLRALLHDTLLSRRVYERGQLERPAVERMIEEHDTGRVNHGLRLWSLLWLELWHQTFIDAPTSTATGIAA